MTSRFADLYDRLVLGHAKITLFVLVAIFVFFAFWARDFRLDASADSLLLENDKSLRLFRQVTERYKTKEFLFVTFTPNTDLFSDKSLHTISSLEKDLTAIPGVDSVFSLMDVPLVKQKEGTLLELAANYRTLRDADVDRAKAKQELMHSPLFSERVISNDGETTALILYLKGDAEYESLQKQRNELLIKKYGPGLSADEQAQLDRVNDRYDAVKTRVNSENHQTLQKIRDAVKNYQGDGVLYIGGVPMIVDDMISFIRSDLVVFGVGVTLFMLAMLAIIFRRKRWVALPVVNCIYSSTIMVGLLGLVGWSVTVISSNFISLMLIVTMSMNIHLIVRYRQLRSDHPDWDQRKLVFETSRRLVWPCLYTALTTMMGFGSLVVSDIKPVIDFGWMMTMGLFVTFLTSFLLFPSILVLMKPTPVPRAEDDHVPFMRVLANITERHGTKVLVISLLFGIASVLGMTRLRVENSFINNFSPKTEIYQGLKLIDDKLGGTTTLDVLLKFGNGAKAQPESPDDAEFEAMFGKQDKADSWFTPDKVDEIKEVHDYLDSLPAVGKVLSLASTVRLAESLVRTHEGFNTFELAILYKRLPPELREKMIDPYVSLDNDEARITMRIRDSLKNLRRKELLDKIQTDLHTKLGLGTNQYQLTGLLVLYNNMLQSLFRSQILTLGVVMLGIMVMLLLLFRSVSLAMIGIIPQILAALMVLGLMGWLDIPLDLMTITIAAITIGIAVDNAIHYIYRFKEEFPHHSSYLETMHYCHAHIGRAVYYTAITIIVGFSILMLSKFVPTVNFGLLTALAMFGALLAALTLLPKLILVWKPFGPAGTATNLPKDH